MGSNASELGRTLAELTRMGRLEKVDAARVQMARSMARALDEDPSNAALWGRYHVVVKELVIDDDSGAVADALAELFT
jgi:hypothetical protein